MGNICNHKVPIHCIAAVLANILTSMSGKLCKVCRSRDNICWQTGQDCYYFRYLVQQPQCEPLSPPGGVPQPGDGVVEEEGLDEDEEVDHDPGHGHHAVTCHDAVTCHVCELVPHDTDHDTSDTGHH